MQQYVLEDSSFVIATIDPNDKFHADSVLILEKILQSKDKIKVIIPSVVFFETIFTLLKKGIDNNTIEQKLWNFLYLDQIINITLIETMAFKLAKQLNKTQIGMLKTTDYLIASVGIQFNAHILTFDRQMYKRVKPVHHKIYYCSSIDNYEDETISFLERITNSSLVS